MSIIFLESQVQTSIDRDLLGDEIDVLGAVGVALVDQTRVDELGGGQVTQLRVFDLVQRVN